MTRRSSPKAGLGLEKLPRTCERLTSNVPRIPFSLLTFVFHAQQAAEKALKGFLVWHGRTFRKTHSLEDLGEQCLKINAGLKPLIDRAVPLTEYAWKFRYPGDVDEPDTEEADQALAVARELFEGILNELPSDVRP